MALNLQRLVKQKVNFKTVKFSTIGSKSQVSLKQSQSQRSIKASKATMSQDDKDQVHYPQGLNPIVEAEGQEDDRHVLSVAQSRKSNRMDISTLSAFNVQDLVKLVIMIVLFGILLSLIGTFVFPGFNSTGVPTVAEINIMVLPIYAIIALYFICKVFFIYNYRHINDIYGLRIEAYATFGFMTLGYVFIVGGVGGFPNYNVMLVLLTILHTLINVFPVLYGYYDRSKLAAVQPKSEEKTTTAAAAAVIVDTFAQDGEQLRAVLKNSELLYPFKQTCSQAYCLEAIVFIEQMEELRSMNIKVIPDAPLNPTMKRKLEKIVNTFIVYGSSYEIKIDENLRQNLIVMYGKNNVKFMEDLDRAYEEIFASLVKEVFPRFKMKNPGLVPEIGKSK